MTASTAGLSEEESQQSASATSSRHAKSPDTIHIRYEPLGIEAKVFFFICALTPIAPLVVLLTSSTSSSSISQTGCLPDGTFALPGTRSVSLGSYFLSINVPVTSATVPWTFTHAKIVNVIWDLLVGRGLQIILVFTAFHVFSKVLLRLMEREEIPFRTYGAVSFQPGTFSAFFKLITAIRAPPPEEPLLPGGQNEDQRSGNGRSWKARAAILVMALLTLYIAVLPTLLSAMNGYYALSYPSLSYYPTKQLMIEMGLTTDVACDILGSDNQLQGIAPAWGVLLDAERVHLDPSFLVLEYPPDPAFLRYYAQNKDAYDQMATDPTCIGVEDTSSCNATDIYSTFTFNQTAGAPLWMLDPPLLNLQVFPPFNTIVANSTPSPGILPSTWTCGNQIFDDKDFFPQFGFSFPNVTGTCNGLGNYRWGFSYPLTLLVCVLNLVGAITLFALWLYGTGDAQGTRRAKESTSTIRAAAHIIDQARTIYGDEAVNGTWNADEMDQNIYGGKRGMRIKAERNTPEAKESRRWRGRSKENKAKDEEESSRRLSITRNT
jgi:hypothetical protein